MKLKTIGILTLYDKNEEKLKATLKISYAQDRNKIGIFVASNGGKKGNASNPHYNDAINLLLEILKQMGIMYICAYHAPNMNLRNICINNERIIDIDHKVISRKLQEAGGPPNGPIYITASDQESINKQVLLKLSQEIVLTEYMKKGSRSICDRTINEKVDVLHDETKKNHSFFLTIVGLASTLLGGYFLYRHFAKNSN